MLRSPRGRREAPADNEPVAQTLAHNTRACGELGRRRYRKFIRYILDQHVSRRVSVEDRLRRTFLRISVRSLLTLCALILGFSIFAPPALGYASEQRAYGDVEVGAEQTAEGVSTIVGDVTVNGLVESDVVSVSGGISVNGPVEGDVRSGFGDIEVNAPVGGRVDVGFGDVYINSRVDGDVHIGRGSLRLGPDARISGDSSVEYGATFWGEDSAVGRNPPSGTYSEFDVSNGGDESSPLGSVILFLAVLGFVACSLLAAVAAPGLLSMAAQRAEEYPGWSLFIGVASAPAAVILSALLAISVLGIPLLLLVVPAYLALVFFGALVTACLVGRKVMPTVGRYGRMRHVAPVLGALVVAAAYLIPFLGSLLLSTLALFGTGAVILALVFRSYSQAPDEAHVQARRDG